jgi:hypothetical protein
MGASGPDQPKHGDTEQHTASYERGTEALPIIVKAITDPPSKAEAEKKDAAEKAKAAVDRKLVELTGSLALYTGLLFAATVLLALGTGALVIVGFLQVKDAKDSIAAAVKAAKAAEDQVKLARDEFNATHRPKIVLRELRFFEPTANQNAYVRFELVNAGSGTAILGSCEFEVSKDGGFQDFSNLDRHTSFSGEELKVGERRPCSESSLIQYREFSNAFASVFWKGSQDPKDALRIFFIGRVKYFDGNRLVRQSAFYREYDFALERFRAGDDPEREYAD